MCYHKLFIFTICGHCLPSAAPLTTRCPPCPSKSTNIFSTPSLASPIEQPAQDTPFDCLPSVWELEVSEALSASLSPGEYLTDSTGIPNQRASPTSILHNRCTTRLAHPFHTYLIHSLCTSCSIARVRRLAKFEVDAAKSETDRENTRKRGRSRINQQPRLTIQSLKSTMGAGPKRLSGGASNPLGSNGEGPLSLKAIGLGIGTGMEKVKDRIIQGLMSPTSTTAAPRMTALASGIQPRAEESVDIGPWSSNPLLKNPLKLSIIRSRGRNVNTHSGTEEELSPEHFAVPSLLHDSQESLTTDGISSRRTSRDTRMEVK